MRWGSVGASCMMRLWNRNWYPRITRAPWCVSSWAIAHAIDSSLATPMTSATLPLSGCFIVMATSGPSVGL